MKKLLVLASLLSGAAFADQCAYIQTSPNKMVNLAKATACSTLDEKSVPSTLRIKN